MKKPIGYFVTESCGDYEQVLGMRHDDTTPPLGVLDWTHGPRALFRNRTDARSAIERTEHFRLAWNFSAGSSGLPEKKFCKIIPVADAG